jgi:hypothetical protein
LGISSPLLTRKNHVQQQNPGIGYPFQAALTFVSEVDRKRPGVFDIDFMEGPLKVFCRVLIFGECLHPFSESRIFLDYWIS